MLREALIDDADEWVVQVVGLGEGATGQNLFLHGLERKTGLMVGSSTAKSSSEGGV